MEDTIESSLTSFKCKAYISLVKPGILFGNAVTAMGGFALASKGSLHWPSFVLMLVGLCLIMASACVFNNYIDREADQKMKRTKNRPLAQGSIPLWEASIFATILGFVGVLVLSFTNLLTLSIALLGFVIYVLVYSFSKYRTSQGTLIGSVAGAVPPVVGYCAVTNHFDLGALILFAMIALWQMPHFFAIAIYRYDDYAAASIPVLPIKKGIRKTKHQMFLYVVAFAVTSLLLTIAGYTGPLYTITAITLGLAWIALTLVGYGIKDTKQDTAPWARKMFIVSLLVVITLFAVMSFSCC